MVYREYNLTGMNNSTGIVELMQTVNEELMFNYFGLGLLLAIFVVSFISFFNGSGGNTSKSFAASSFICFAFSILFMMLGIIPSYLIYVCLILAAVSIVMVKNR